MGLFRKKIDPIDRAIEVLERAIKGVSGLPPGKEYLSQRAERIEPYTSSILNLVKEMYEKGFRGEYYGRIAKILSDSIGILNKGISEGNEVYVKGQLLQNLYKLEDLKYSSKKKKGRSIFLILPIIITSLIMVNEITVISGRVVNPSSVSLINLIFSGLVITLLYFLYTKSK